MQQDFVLSKYNIIVVSRKLRMHCLLMQQNCMSVISCLRHGFVLPLPFPIFGLEWDGRCWHPKAGISISFKPENGNFAPNIVLSPSDFMNNQMYTISRLKVHCR